MNSHIKAKSAAKIVIPHGERLDNKVLDTMKTISDLVGSTLGPAGSAVLLERQDYGLPNIVTKDGVTCFKYLGFSDPVAHCIMESARDTATRTATEAGDGTTTATVLAEALVRHTHSFCKRNPTYPKQKVSRILQKLFKDEIEPKIEEWAIKPTEKMLHSVATVSVNGETELADVIMECFNHIGDDGNVSIVEMVGQSKYELELIKGYPLSTGYEEAQGSRFQLFLNDAANNRTLLQKPVFVLYHGVIGDIQTIKLLMEKIGHAWEHPEIYGLDKPFNHNVVLVAHGFSDSVINNLAANFVHQETINVVPLKTYKTAIINGEYNLLHDLSAVTGAKVFDPVTAPLEAGELVDLGHNIDSIEINRYRTTIVGNSDEGLILARCEELRREIESAESQLHTLSVQDRLAKLTNGIAKLKVFGPSSAETRERRDRAEDATYSVRGARKHGCLPGGGWTLIKLFGYFTQPKYLDNPVINEILKPSFKDVVFRLLLNCGLADKECMEVIGYIDDNMELYPDKYVIYNGWTGKMVNALEAGILDSVPAVLEAIRSSISIAGLLGTLGGVVVYGRDEELERREAALSLATMRDSGLTE